MRAGGAFGDAEPGGDLLVGAAFCDEPEDLGLAGVELDGGLLGPARAAGELLGGLNLEVDVTRGPRRLLGLLPRRPTLLVGILALNLANLPMMLAGEGAAAPMAGNAYLLPTAVLVTIVVAWLVVGRYASPRPRLVPAPPVSDLAAASPQG